MRALAQRLYESARTFLLAALKAEADGQMGLFLLHAGTAIEHLSKARLADINPLLIADGKLPPATLLWLADETKHDKPVPGSLRTIGLERALDLVKHRSAVNRYATTLEALRQQRNGVAHVGDAVTDEIPTLMPEIIASVVALAEGLVADPMSIFGDYRDFARAQLDSYDEEEQRVLAVRTEQARVRFAERFPDLAPEVRQAMAAAITSSHRDTRVTVDEQLAPCPVCELPAALDGELLVEWEVDVDGGPDGPSYSAYPVGHYLAVSLKCSTCGLVLDSPALIDRSGALENWHVSEEDAEEAASEQAYADYHG